MSEQVIVTKRGTFGKVQVTVPMTVKETMMAWCKKSGMGKAEFYRVSLMLGVNTLAGLVNARKPDEDYFNNSEGEHGL